MVQIIKIHDEIGPTKTCVKKMNQPYMCVCVCIIGTIIDTLKILLYTFHKFIFFFSKYENFGMPIVLKKVSRCGVHVVSQSSVPAHLDLSLNLS